MEHFESNFFNLKTQIINTNPINSNLPRNHILSRHKINYNP